MPSDKSVMRVAAVTPAPWFRLTLMGRPGEFFIQPRGWGLNAHSGRSQPLRERGREKERATWQSGHIFSPHIRILVIDLKIIRLYKNPVVHMLIWFIVAKCTFSPKLFFQFCKVCSDRRLCRSDSFLRPLLDFHICHMLLSVNEFPSLCWESVDFMSYFWFIRHALNLSNKAG